MKREAYCPLALLNSYCDTACKLRISVHTATITLILHRKPTPFQNMDILTDAKPKTGASETTKIYSCYHLEYRNFNTLGIV